MENLHEAMTKQEYDNFVADRGRTPTQDPVYNHQEGDPLWRPAARQDGPFAGRPTSGLGPQEDKPHISEASPEERAEIFKD